MLALAERLLVSQWALRFDLIVLATLMIGRERYDMNLKDTARVSEPLIRSCFERLEINIKIEIKRRIDGTVLFILRYDLFVDRSFWG